MTNEIKMVDAEIGDAIELELNRQRNNFSLQHFL